MHCTIPVAIAIDLHDLLLAAEQTDASRAQAEESWFISYGQSSAIMGVVGEDFALAVVANGWCIGEHSQPWQFHFTGDPVETFRWLRGRTTNRLMHHLVDALPLDPEDAILCRLL